jgi:hypothetical protein
MIEQSYGPSRLSHTGLIDTATIEVKVRSTPGRSFLLVLKSRRNESADFHWRLDLDDS